MTPSLVTNSPLIMVSGPTASGKTFLSNRIAQKIDAEIINIDSVQIYKEFDIGAAKPTEGELQQVRHHLVGVLEPNQKCNVADFVSLAEERIINIQSRDKKVILAGGTTMYITCLLQGLDDLPPSDPELRARLESLTTHELYLELQKIDPKTAQILSGNDRVRMVRALEASILGGKPVSQIKKENQEQREIRHHACILVLCWKRDQLYERINQRVDHMLSEGLLNETRELIAKYGTELPALKSLGYSQAAKALDSEITVDELAAEISMFTRRFAKRQSTYWRNEPVKRGWEILPEQPQVAERDFNVLDWGFDELIEHLKEVNRAQLDKTLVWYLDAAKVLS